jgi:hypothetical protein
MRRIVLGVLVVLAVVLAVGRPHGFTDPMTHRDGGVVATWGPVTCAAWTWSEPDVVTTGPPVNCFQT